MNASNVVRRVISELVEGCFLSTRGTGVVSGDGAGGVVTQATDKTTGVTLNKAAGAVTMNAASLAAGTIVAHTLTNSLIEAGDQLVLSHQSGGTLGSYTLNAACAAGSATVQIRNNTAGALAEAVVYRFQVIKSAQD